MAGYPKPKKYKVKNKSKYVGDINNVVCRSSWETKLCRKLDESKYVVSWGVEPFAIPYISPVDNKQHRYFPDFIITSKNKSGGTITTLVEVKPHIQTIEPVMKRGKKKKTYFNECVTYCVNKAKWKYAEDLCNKKGWVFKIFTENELNV